MTAGDRGRFDPRRKFRSAAIKLKLSHGAKRLFRNSSFRLLDWRARARRPRLGHVTFVGVTGSCGKTTTTAFRDYPPRQKPGSFNLDRVMEAVTAGSQGNQ
jgi:hypothetical protein